MALFISLFKYRNNAHEVNSSQKHRNVFPKNLMYTLAGFEHGTVFLRRMRRPLRHAAGANKRFLITLGSTSGQCNNRMSNQYSRYCGFYLGLTTTGGGNQPVCGKSKPILGYL
jgi:hypothetical protein